VRQGFEGMGLIGLIGLMALTGCSPAASERVPSCCAPGMEMLESDRGGCRVISYPFGRPFCIVGPLK
jgi:hypothetical protein